MISPANTNPVITDRGLPNVNRVCGRDDVQGVVGSEFAAATLKAKSVYIIHDKTAYGQGVAEFFKTRSEEHTSELPSLMRISYAVFCMKKKKNRHIHKQKT